MSTFRTTLCTLLVLPSLGCPGGVGQIPPTWELTSFESSHTRAEDGDEVTLTWAYSTDEPLLSQRLCFLYLYYDGLGEECYDLEPEQREQGFVYGDAVTVYLMGTSDRGQAQGTLKVRDLVDAYLRVLWKPVDAGYPYLGDDPQVEFSHFAAIYDDDGDAKIDALTPLYGEGNYDFFRARTWDLYETAASTFNATTGPYFPLQHPLHPHLGYANLVVNGGAIVITGGEPHEFKPEQGEEATAQLGSQLYFDSVFLQLSYLWGEVTGILTPTDIEVGNMTQGLVLGHTSTNQSGSLGSAHAAQIMQVGSENWVSGSLSFGVASHTIAPYVDPPSMPEFRTVQVRVEAAEWQMPITLDQDVGAVPHLTLLPAPPAPGGGR
ncbi:MAG: hypothetical protein KTR31_34445 [Myxococcales bacterium]|nr:hypothetical protein [Myxococcales bacterium]